VSDASPKVLKLSFEVSECKPLAPGTHSHVSTANSDKTTTSLREMGARLAEETAEVMAELEGGALTPRGGGRQGRTLVHFSAQPEPFLTQNTP
jgi:hypothetical protein